MLESLMLKREWFPLRRTEGEKTYAKYPYEIIPFLHPHLVKNGIDFDYFTVELIQEIENIASLDAGKEIKLGDKKFERNYLFFPEYEEGLCVHPHKITPSGGDSGIYIEGDIAEKNGSHVRVCSQKGVYELPKGIKLNDEILREYQIEQEGEDNCYTLRVQRGWDYHNVYNPGIIKSVVIALNNLVVKEIHSK